MTTDSMFDLTIRECVDGGFELEQSAGALDPDDVQRIYLHRAQMWLVAERAGLSVAAPTGPGLNRLCARHLERLDERVSTFFRLYHDHVIERCGDGIEISMLLCEVRGLVDDLIEDSGGATNVTPVLPSVEPSVTPAASASDADKKRTAGAEQPQAPNGSRVGRRSPPDDLLSLATSPKHAVADAAGS